MRWDTRDARGVTIRGSYPTGSSIPEQKLFFQDVNVDFAKIIAETTDEIFNCMVFC